MAVVPAGLEMDWGCWTNSAGAGWGAQKSMTSGKGQVERDETAGSEGMRKGEGGWDGGLLRTGWVPNTRTWKNPPGVAQAPGDDGRPHLYPPQRQTQERTPF